ncbi:HVO_0476 family zinc finger protein [Methanocella conradii]|uniref:HVO_0476 family zinc finger protein n=1 Tax=Methanocella conradii TaxID=1175444 RepID=UPI00157DDE5D|nr:HVO_0476 family zinc finger protein [Methanocella conradii]MDI6897090.1 HVO_0476 family zinc finger protein [Methanocella conradii]
MDKIEVVEAACPQCSPEEEVMHTVVKSHLLKCNNCGFIHRLPSKKRKAVKLKVIVSRQDVSSVQEIEVNEDEELHVGDEFVVDVGEEVSGVRVQSLELKTGGRAESAKAGDVRAVWARAIDEVVVKIAVQRREKTESVDYKVNGDYEFTVGDILKVKGHEVRVSAIKVRDGGLYKREGKSARAKDIRRIYSKILSSERRPVGEGLRASRKKGGKGSEDT